VLARHAWSAAERLDLHADLAGLGRCHRPILRVRRKRNASSTSAPRRGGSTRRWRSPSSARSGPIPFTLATANGLGGLARMARINPFETMWKGLGRHFRDRRLQQLFGRYATYCGSSPFLAPATLMLVAHVEQAGVWTVKGGMHELALALCALARRKGVEIRFGGRCDRHCEKAWCRVVPCARRARNFPVPQRDRECRCQCGWRRTSGKGCAPASEAPVAAAQALAVGDHMGCNGAHVRLPARPAQCVLLARL
jgi:hypothetical protein